MADDKPDRSCDRPTRIMSTEEILGSANTNVAIAFAALERLGPWALDAFKRGLLSTLDHLSAGIAAGAPLDDIIPQMRALVDLLAKFPD